MSLQISFLSESGAANRADVRTLIGMSVPMTVDASLAAEGLVADVASIRLSIGVPGRVFIQFLLPPETAVAESATVRQDLGMVESVHVQGRLLLEGLAAGLAHVGSLVGVGPPVLVPRRLRGKMTAAHVAGEVLNAVVDISHVPVQTGRRSEALVAIGTDVGSHAGVNVPVNQQIVRRGKSFPAIFTFVRGTSVTLLRRPRLS